MVQMPTWMVDFYGFHVGKYTSPMDDMGIKKKQTYGIYLKKVDVCKKFPVSTIVFFFWG